MKRKGPGRPKLLSQHEEAIKSDFRRSPKDVGYFDDYWSQELAKKHIEQHYEERVSKSKAGSLLPWIDKRKRLKEFQENFESLKKEVKNQIWYIGNIEVGKIPINVPGRKPLLKYTHYLFYAICDENSIRHAKAPFYCKVAADHGKVLNTPKVFSSFIKDAVRNMETEANGHAIIFMQPQPIEKQAAE